MYDRLPVILLNIIYNCFLSEKDRISLKCTCKKMNKTVDLKVHWQVKWDNHTYSGIGYEWSNFDELCRSLSYSHIRPNILGSEYTRLCRRILRELGKHHKMSLFLKHENGTWKKYKFQQMVNVVDLHTWESYEYENNDLTLEDVYKTKKGQFTISLSRPPYQFGE